ncbi:MAG: hypothetical protein ABR520_04575 [Mycobacteriales bacterium]
MAAPIPELPPVVDPRSDLERSPEQVAHEAVMTEVAETLLNVEQAIRRAERARRTVAVSGRDPNRELALTELVTRLEELRRNFFQATYFAADQQRLL